MRKNKVRLVALALAGALLAGLLSPCVALAADSSTITIQSMDHPAYHAWEICASPGAVLTGADVQE